MSNLTFLGLQFGMPLAVGLASLIRSLYRERRRARRTAAGQRMHAPVIPLRNTTGDLSRLSA